MPRYIDADATNRYLQSEYHGMISDESLKIYEIMRLLYSQPPVDVARVKRGEWVKKKYVHEYADETTEERYYDVCSECGKQPPNGFGKVNFCHNCGADMR